MTAKEMMVMDVLVLIIGGNWLILQDNLESFEINPKDYFISKKLMNYCEGNYTNFKSNLTDFDIKKL